VPRTGNDRAKLRLVISVDRPDKAAFGTLLNRPLRDENRLQTRCADELCCHELSRTQQLIRIRDLRTQQECSGFLADRRIGESDTSFVRIQAAVGEHDLDLEVAIVRVGNQSVGNFLARFEYLVLRDAELDPHGIELRHISEQTVTDADIRAFTLYGVARKPRHRGFYIGVAKIEFRLHHCCLGFFNGRASAAVRAERVVEVLLRNGFLFRQRLDAFEIDLSVLEARVLLGETRLGGFQGSFKGQRIHLEEHVTGLHHRAFDIILFVEEPFQSSADLDSARTGGLADELDHNRRILRFDLDDGHRHRWRLGDGDGFFLTAAE